MHKSNDSDSPETQASTHYVDDLVEELRSRLATVQAGGSERSIDRHHSRGKVLARERIALLADPDTSFAELSPLAAWGMYDAHIASAAVVTGIATVHGRHVVVIANDVTVKGGTYYPISVSKHLRAQEIALENQLPCIYLVDSGGAHLPFQAQLFADRDHGGRFFFNQAQMSALGIPQIACVMGSCTAGAAYVPAMCDESVIVNGTGTVYLAGPALTYAATGEIVSDEELGGAEVHTKISGLCDHFAESDTDALNIVRTIISRLPTTNEAAKAIEHDPPQSDCDVNGLIDQDTTTVRDPRALIAGIVDGGRFNEFKESYARDMICGFARIHGHKLGIASNHDRTNCRGSLKAAHFVELCCERHMPIVFLESGLSMATNESSEPPAETMRHAAKLTHVIARASVPKFTVVTGGIIDLSIPGLCGRALQPRQLWLWPNAHIKVADVGGSEIIQDAYYSTARVFDDGIIEPKQTRDILGLALAAASQSMAVKTTLGVLRM